MSKYKVITKKEIENLFFEADTDIRLFSSILGSKTVESVNEIIDNIKCHLLINKCSKRENSYCYLVVSKVRYTNAHIEVPQSIHINILCKTKEYINNILNTRGLDVDSVVYNEIKDNINEWCEKGHIYKKSKEVLNKETYDLSIIVKDIESIVDMAWETLETTKYKY